MTTDDNSPFLTEAEVLKLPWYARGRTGKGAVKTTLLRHRKSGLRGRDGTRHRLRAYRMAGGTFYRRSDVDAFFNAINGFDAADTATASALSPCRARAIDNAESEFLDAVAPRRAVAV